MPLYAMIGWDGPDSAALRQQHRPAHLAGLEGLAADGKIRHAGPLLDAEGKPQGSLVGARRMGLVLHQPARPPQRGEGGSKH